MKKNGTSASSLVFLIAGLFATTQTLLASVFVVSTSEELQAALSAAASNGGDDEILLGAGTYFGNFKFLSEEDFALRVTSENQSEPAVIDARGRNFGLYIEGNKTRANVELSNLVIRKAFSVAQGGGLLARSLYGSLLLDRIVLEGNIAREGGGLYAANIGQLTLRGSTLRDNLAGFVTPDGSEAANEPGGGASLRNVAEVDIVESAFEGNRGSTGGALYISNNNLEMPWASTRRVNLKDTKFLRNAADVSIYLNITASGNSDLTVEDNSFTKNLSGMLSIDAYATPITINNNSFIDNECGAVALRVNLDGPNNAANEFLFEKNLFTKNIGCKWFYLESMSDRSNHQGMIRGNLFEENVFGFSADRSGFEKLSIVNNSFVGFDESSYAAFGSDFEVTIANNIFYSTIHETGFELRGVLKRGVLKNNIYQKIGGYWDVDAGNQVVDPGFFDADGGDFHLGPDSPAIDAGDSSFVMETEATDLDGNPRIGNSSVDVGAYERETTSLHPADTNGDQKISQSEFDEYNAAWRTNGVWQTAPAIISADFVTRAGYLLQKGGSYKNIGVGKPQTWVPLDD